MATVRIRGIDQSSDDRLNEMLSLCHDAKDLSLAAFDTAEDEALAQFFTVSAESFRETISLIETMIENRDGQATGEGTLVGAADRLFTFVKAAAAKDSAKTVVDEYLQSLNKMLANFKVALAEGRLQKSEREPLLERLTLHELQWEHLQQHRDDPESSVQSR